VGTKVLYPLRACVNVADYCDPSSTCTLTYVKSLAMMFESIVPSYPNDSQERIISSYFGKDD
jgi:hypothetical protein